MDASRSSMAVLPDPAAREEVIRENEADPLAGEQTWPTDMVRCRTWRFNECTFFPLWMQSSSRVYLGNNLKTHSCPNTMVEDYSGLAKGLRKCYTAATSGTFEASISQCQPGACRQWKNLMSAPDRKSAVMVYLHITCLDTALKHYC